MKPSLSRGCLILNSHWTIAVLVTQRCLNREPLRIEVPRAAFNFSSSSTGRAFGIDQIKPCKHLASSAPMFSSARDALGTVVTFAAEKFLAVNANRRKDNPSQSPVFSTNCGKRLYRSAFPDALEIWMQTDEICLHTSHISSRSSGVEQADLNLSFRVGAVALGERRISV